MCSILSYAKVSDEHTASIFRPAMRSVSKWMVYVGLEQGFLTFSTSQHTYLLFLS
jgi:hypothetical protein